MPNYDQTGPRNQKKTGRRGQACQANNPNNTNPNDSLLNGLRRRLRDGTNQQGGQQRQAGKGNCRNRS